MTFEEMIRSHDESVLETMTSKGLLRRAQRDVVAGLGSVQSTDGEKATISVDGRTVMLDNRGPRSASCTCKAHGVCRHILAAMLLLRGQLDESAASGDRAKLPRAVSRICSLTDDQLAKFAGTDWGKAIGLVTDELPVTLEDEGLNITVRLMDMNATVTFIAGNGLRDAAYKGPKTRRRLLTTVAALAIRRSEKLPLPDASGSAQVTAAIGEDFLAQARQTIQQAVSATLPSRSDLARDLFLDLAISSRCEALPRVAAELRSLAQQSQLARERSAEFEPASFLLDASRTYALVETLQKNSSDSTLTGSVRRDYVSGEAIDLWPLGVARWRSQAGARGLSAYLFDANGRRWHTLIEGRAAGTDALFDVSNAYRMPVWGAGTLKGVMGHRVRLPQPSIAPDGSISSRSGSGTVSRDALSCDEVLQRGAAHTNWQEFRKEIAVRMGSGVRRLAVPLPALLSPSAFGSIGFDDLSQAYQWEVRDDAGDSLVLSIPADDDESALRLWRLGNRILAIVVEARLDRQAMEIRPVSVLQRDRSRIAVHNVDFDHWPVESGVRKVISTISESVAKPLATAQIVTDPIDQVVSDAAEELASIVSGSTRTKSESIGRRLEACGLVTLSDILGRAALTDDLHVALTAAYVTSELKAILALQHRS